MNILEEFVVFANGKLTLNSQREGVKKTQQKQAEKMMKLSNATFPPLAICKNGAVHFADVDHDRLM